VKAQKRLAKQERKSKENAKSRKVLPLGKREKTKGCFNKGAQERRIVARGECTKWKLN
jgi:hypothetical protein